MKGWLHIQLNKNAGKREMGGGESVICWGVGGTDVLSPAMLRA